MGSQSARQTVADFPELLTEWHPHLNGELSPTEVTAGSKQKTWWQGSCGHTWDESPGNRSRQKLGCPFCSNHRILRGFNDLFTKFPQLQAEWDEVNSKEGNLLAASSPYEAHWVCAAGHKWVSPVKARTQKGKITQCPVCSGRQVIPGVNDLATTHPEVAIRWDHERNTPLTPNEVWHKSVQKVWWLCPSNLHSHDQMITTAASGKGCRFCAGTDLLRGFNDLATKFPELAAEWDVEANGGVLPSDVMAGSNRKVFWQAACGHEGWKTSVAKRQNGSGCPTCAGKRGATPGVTDIFTLFPNLADEWHPERNSDIDPTRLGSGAGAVVWWRCQAGHEWEATVYSRAAPNTRNGCGKCSGGKPVSQQETRVTEFVESLGVGEVVTSTRKLMGNAKEIDIWVPSAKIAIEFNGIYHHSEQTGKGRNYHHDKWLACKERGIQLIQVWSDDWRYREDVVKQMLARKLSATSESDRIYARKTRVVQLTREESRTFLDKHHIQGSATGSTHLGLVAEKQEGTQVDSEVVAVLVLKRESSPESKTLNIVRFATSRLVPGGFSKLLKHAERTYQPDRFITFSDHCVSDGGLYESNGFVADKELPPDYMYVVGNRRRHKFGYRLNRFRTDPKLQWEEGMSERELAQLNGLYRIWDAGKTRWVKTLIQPEN